ncbi:MAG: MoaD/ThiS family protein [Aggregatilineales bacterium]
MSSIKIPTPLRAYTGNQATIAVDGTTVGEALGNLVSQHPDLKQHLFDGDSLRNFVNVFIGDEDVRFLDGMDTEISADDNLRIIPSIAGGSTCCC